jgi:hypothetical protein
MPTIAEVRQQYPQYSDMSDTDLAGALHKKFYSDMPVEQFNQKIGLASAPTAPDKPRTWAEVPGEAVSNIPSSAAHLVTGQLKQAADVGAYSLPKLAGGLLGPIAGAVTDSVKALIKDPELITKLPKAAYDGLMARYGSEDALKKTIATDPVGFALDAATVVGGGEALASRVGRGVGEIARVADVSRPFHEIVPAERPPPPPAPPPVPAEPPPIPSPVQEAIQSQPRALTTDSRFQQQAGQVLSKIPLVGDRLGTAIEAVPERFGAARTAVADELGNYRTPQNIAGDIGGHIGTAAEAETAAAEAAARQADEAARVQWERTNQEREALIARQEARSAEQAQAQIGNVAPVEMGDAVIDTVRANHENVRAAKDAAYADAGAREGTIYDPAIGRADRVVNADLRTERGGPGIVETDPTLTPAAHRMRQQLADFGERARQRQLRAQQEAIDGGGVAADAEQTGLNLRRIEQQRQRLNAMAQNASTPGDRRAAARIIDAFDHWQQRAMEGPHFEGDPDVLGAFQRARAANRDFRQRFGYNDRNDADAILNKIVQPGDQIGSEDIAKALFAGGGKPSRLLDAIFQATGDHPNHGNVVQAVRGGVWNKLSGLGEGERGASAETVASNINKFLNRRDMADRIYSPQDQALARGHAQVLRQAVEARDAAAQAAKTSKPVPTEVTKGPMQELADRVLGRGQKSEEALFDTLEGYAKSKGGGRDIATLARVMSSIPEELRGNFRNTFIRRLGTGLKGEFSPAKFADEWTTKVNPQAKSVLFGDGAHVRALDDLASASKQFDQVHRRFGNPSGSGQAINFGKIATIAGAAATGTLIGPVKLLGGWFVGRKFANFLATPQGAASASRFAQQMQRLQGNPSLGNAAAVQMSMRNMRNTALALGIETKIPDREKK